MRQNWSFVPKLRSEWKPFWPQWPTSDPQEVTETADEYSNDLILSENHHVFLLGKTRQDLGGPFHAVKRDYSESSTVTGNGFPKYTHFSKVDGDPFGNPASGHILTTQVARHWGVTNDDFPTVLPSSPDVLDTLGTVAISRVAPTRPAADVATFLGELHEGLPTAIGLESMSARSLRARNAGSEYLNAEFGWRPLVSDVNSMGNAVINAERIIDQYANEAGKLLKRRYDFPIEEEVEHFDYGSNNTPQPIMSTSYYKSGGYKGNLTMTRTTRTRHWFKGAFTFYLAEPGSFVRRTQDADKLLGLQVTPETLWNLAPWSWAIDWFTGLGPMITALSLLHSDGLVMPYAYMMEEKSIQEDWTLSGIRYKSYDGEQTFHQSFTTTVKYRRKATPFGFGVDFESLTNRQLAILAALGLSRFG